MRKFLSHDLESGELRLVFADLWDGQHERTEYTVVNSDGSRMRNRPELDGVTVWQDTGPEGFRWYVLGATSNHHRYISTEGTAETVRTPCRRLASPSGRAKCALCAADS
jgi:hypothetical protein